LSSSSGLTGNRRETRHPYGGESLDLAVSQAYQELRAIAHYRLAGQVDGGTFSTTALVNETYLKLADNSPREWGDRAHFLAVASLAMRHVIVDRARERATLKRGGAPQPVTLDEESASADEQVEIVLHLNEALDRLAEWDPRLGRVVECRFFGGLSEAETAEVLGVTVRTVQRDWVKARVLLRRALES
jgi:RNA polymerase sigma factor (TIGR02999 family)